METLSPFEQEVLQLFWQRGHMTAREAHAMLDAQRELAYTTVKTIIDRLERKGALAREAQVGRTIVYRALVDPRATRRGQVQRFLASFFRGNRQDLLTALLEEEQLSLDELAYLQRVVAQGQIREGEEP
jgi:BlaI family penicillinase repressor